MSTTPRGHGPRFARAAALLAVLSWGSPHQALAQLPGLPVPALPGSLIVTITSPSSGSTVSGTTTVTASVSTVGSLTVAGVQFKLDGANLGGEDTSAPYSISWNTTLTRNGSHTLTAVARDRAGLQFTSDPVSVTVSNDVTPPTVAVTAPSSGSTVSGSITVSASASDDRGVVGVQFRLDGAPLGAEDTSAPYSVAWDTTTATPGPHTLTAVARDAAGNTATSTPVTVTVSSDTTPPTVTITSPGGGASVSGTIVVTASASDPGGVRVVQFLVDGRELALDTTAPYEAAWDTRTVANGTHQLTARAQDTAGNIGDSAVVTVTVANGPPPGDTTPPTVAITSPSSGATVSGTITVTASASDPGGVRAVQFLLDGEELAVDSTAPYEAVWDTRTVVDGTHHLQARAVDTAGNIGESAVVTVTVANPTPAGCPVAPERATLTTFAGNTTFNNTVRAQMWINANTWWGAFSDASSGIYFYKLEGTQFVKGDLIDANFTAGGPDTLWNGRELFVLVYQSGSLAQLHKYTYSTASLRYALVAGFPVDLPLAGLANAIALHQDSTGKLWATYTSGRNVHVIWSTSADHTIWDSSGIVLAADISDVTTEAATLTHFGGNRIGVVWSNQALGEVGFRFHRDGDPETIWSPMETVDCCEGSPGGVADDHLSLRAAPDGRLFLAAKDSVFNGRLHLYIRGLDGTWGPKIRVHPDPLAEGTRPFLLLDVENRHGYVLYRMPADGRIHFSRTSLDTPAFDPPCVLIESASPLNNPTSTKQYVNRTTDLVGAASGQGQIFSGRLDLASSTARASFPGVPGRGVAATAAPALACLVPERPRAVVATANRPGPIFAGRRDWASRLVRVSLDAASEREVPATAVTAQLVGTPVGGLEDIWVDRLSVSPAPADDSQWQGLRARGINTIVNLDDAMVDVGKYGFESFLWVQLGAGAPPADTEAERFLTFIQAADNQPAHISSATSDRRAIMVALVRYAIDGWTLDRALAEGRRLNGDADLSSQQVEWLLGWAARHPPGSHRRTTVSQDDIDQGPAPSTTMSTPGSTGNTTPPA